MMPCSLPFWFQRSEGHEGRPFAFHWSYDASYGSLSHVLTYKAAGALDETSTAPVEYRFLSHVLLDAIPDVALGETLEALKGIWAYYLPVKQQPKLLPKRAVAGQVIRRERPRYSIEDDL